MITNLKRIANVPTAPLSVCLSVVDVQTPNPNKGSFFSAAWLGDLVLLRRHLNVHVCNVMSSRFDSIDALELAMAIHKTFGVKIAADDEANKVIFHSVATLASHIAAHRTDAQGEVNP